MKGGMFLTCLTLSGYMTAEMEKAGNPGKTTIAEATANWTWVQDTFPFQLSNEQDKFYQKNLIMTLPMILKVMGRNYFYHTKEDSRYISEN